MVVEQLVEYPPHAGVCMGVAAGMLVGVADHLRAERVVVGPQIGVAEQHAHTLVQGGELLVAVRAQPGRHVVELERLFEVFLADECELVLRIVGFTERLAYFPGPVAASAELPEIARLELLLHGFALPDHDGPGVLVEAALFEVPRCFDETRQSVLRLVEHAGDRLIQTLANQITALLQEPLELLRSEEHTSELQSQSNLVCRLLLEKKKKKQNNNYT